MKELTFDKKRIFNFSQKYVENQIAAIKREFRDQCKYDNTLSKEFKEHVSNVENITVNFRPKYGYDMYLSLDSVWVNYEFDYTLSYYTDTHIVGDVKINSDGKAHLSNVHTVGEHRSSATQSSGKTHFQSTKLKTCELHLGAAASTDYGGANYVDVTDAPASSLPKALAQLAYAPMTYADINQFLKISSLPQHVYDDLAKSATDFHKNDNPRNLTMSIDNYYIDELEITFLPYAYEFDVQTEFEGETYGQKNLTSIASITSRGPKSSHYTDYLVKVKEAELKFYHSAVPKAKKIYLLAAILPAPTSLAILLIFAFAKAWKHEAFRYTYLFASIGLLVVSIALCVLSALLIFKNRWLHVEDSVYNPRKSVSTLEKDLDALVKDKSKKTLRASIHYLTLITTFTLVIGAGIGLIFHATQGEHFWHTPEIVATYEAEHEEAQYKLSIISCDNEGNVEAIEESVRKDLYAKALYQGKIEKKSKQGCKVTLTLKEKLYEPPQGNFRENYTLTISDDYKQLDGFVDVSMRSDATVFSSALHSPELINTYAEYKKDVATLLTVTDCDTNGVLEATYTQVSSAGYAVVSLKGEILTKLQSNEVYIQFTKLEYLEKTVDIPLDDSIVAYVSEDFSKLQFNELELETSKSDIRFIDSAEDLQKLADTSVLAILRGDIDFNGTNVAPIKSFSGALIGNGHTVKNFVLSPKASATSVGLFESISKNGFVYDVNIENGQASLSQKGNHVGLLCGVANGSLFQISVSGKVTAQGFENVGGIAGYCGGKTNHLISNAEVFGGTSSNPLIGKVKS
ncbi:MAG: hypothetical protein E7606_03090 [Ruminococcaceae bacterium]|nr:hypothetical protein [Oscillospiraceae bacterium]